MNDNDANNMILFSIFFLYEKKIPYVVTRDICRSVCPSIRLSVRHMWKYLWNTVAL